MAKLPGGWGKRLLKKHGDIDSFSSEDEAEEPDDREFRRMDAKRDAKQVAKNRDDQGSHVTVQAFPPAAGNDGMDSDDYNDSDEVEETHIDYFPLSW